MKKFTSILFVLLLSTTLLGQINTRDIKGDGYRLRTWVNKDNPESRHIEIFINNPDDKAALQGISIKIQGIDEVYNENNRYYFSMRVSLMFDLDEVFNKVHAAIDAYYKAKNEN